MLSEQDREIILMRHYEHLSNFEIAEVLGLNPPAASMRYLRALRRLRELLEQEDVEGGRWGFGMSQAVPAQDADREQRLADILSDAADAVCRGELIDLNSMCQAQSRLGG